ncbi:RNA methyltransferase [Neptunicella marina]|uniref:RNA methyltransferase n=1 Tax=Neptunicella marina TaxID=2125989 RepID=A0A8J6IR33_9ALTE|nr:RNA methyltransferase [Neptunicella marina]MBC3764804.1 RNA methyltransferase [Neptunicella marina]
MSDNKVTIGLVNPKSPANVGSILRAAGCFGANKVLYSGQRYARAKAFHTDTKNAQSAIPTQAVDDLSQHIPANATVVGIELVEGAEVLIDFQHPENAFYVFGPEDGSLTQEQLNWCDKVVYLPTKGCLNLAATVNVVLYDRAAKHPDTPRDDELIRQSRDTNNRVKVIKK